MNGKIITHIEINATPEKIWDILTDSKRYPEWNPFIRSVKGVMTSGSPVRLTIALWFGIVVRLNAVISQFDPYTSLSWSGLISMPYFFKNEHFFRIESLGKNSVRLVHGENFNGIGGFFLCLMIRILFLHLYRNMNAALKKHTEQDF